MPDSHWKRISSQVVYKNPWITVREDQVIRPDGKPGIYGVVESPPGVFVVALNENREIYLVRLYRYTNGRISWELPGGGSDNQDLLLAAKRELFEETGLEADKWQAVGDFSPMNGICSEVSQVFIATDLRIVGQGHLKEEGIEEIATIPISNIWSMIQSGEITDGQSIAALTKAAFYLGWI